MNDLEVHVAPDTMNRGDRSITGVCFVRFGAVAFPDPMWSDFVIVVLGWWLRALASAADGEETELQFMDGPFLIRLQPLGNDVARVQFVDERVNREPIANEGTVSLRQALEACQLAASSVLDVCSERGWSDSDVQELKQLVGSGRAV